MNQNEQLKAITDRLKTALEAEDADAIQDAYNDAEELDMEGCDEAVFNEYDEMVTMCNDFIYLII